MRMAASGVRGWLLLLVSLFILLSVNMSVAASEEEIRVRANLPLTDMHVNQMFGQQRGNKYYLYLHEVDKDVYAQVDVTNPDKPVLLNPSALKGTAPEGSVGPSPLAITATQEGGAKPATSALPSQTVNFMDMSNPKDVKAIKTFKGVTSMYSDDARKLVYLVNGDGLWIVSHRLAQPVPICTSGQDCLQAGP